MIEIVIFQHSETDGSLKSVTQQKKQVPVFVKCNMVIEMVIGCMVSMSNTQLSRGNYYNLSESSYSYLGPAPRI